MFGGCDIEMLLRWQRFMCDICGRGGVHKVGVTRIVENRVGNFKNIPGGQRFKLTTVASLVAFVVMVAVAVPQIKSQTPGSGASASLKPDVQPLAFFIGEWNCEGEFIASKKPIAAHISTTPDLDGSLIAFRWTDQAPSTFHALELFGYDKIGKHFSNFIHDSSGGVRLFNSPGWEADTLTWTGNMLSASATPSERFVIERKSAKEFVITWETRKPDVDWKAGDRLTCKQ
jgi:hypothetical protein